MDDDNAVRLERLRKQRDSSLKDVVNDAIRRGLNALEAQTIVPAGRVPEPADLGALLFPTLKEAQIALEEEADRRKLARP